MNNDNGKNAGLADPSRQVARAKWMTSKREQYRQIKKDSFR